MVDNDEAGMVNAINRFFKEQNLQGIAYRRKQHRFTSQFLDIMVDTAEDHLPDIAIEHKSFKTSSSRKLYFSQHFSSDTDGSFLDATHQIERVHEFGKRSGYKLFLAVEVGRGRGKSKRLFILPWDIVLHEYRAWDNDEEDCIAGFSQEWMEAEGIEVERDGQEWNIHKELFQLTGVLDEQ